MEAEDQLCVPDGGDEPSILDLPGADRVPVCSELPSLVFTAGSAEGIDDGSEFHVNEACTLYHCHPPCARQGTGYSPGP